MALKAGRALAFTTDSVADYLERQYGRTTAYQWVRELAKNAFEADASRVHFGVEWQAVKRDGVYRRTVIDDGFGMAPDDLVEYMATVIQSGLKAEADGENHGIGGRMSLLPWNREGIVVISTVEGGEPHMVQLLYDGEEYRLRRFANGREVTKSLMDREYGIHWRKVIPDWAREHGTVIVLLGSGRGEDTVMGDPNKAERQTLRHPLIDRFYDFGDRRISVEEFGSKDRSEWPRSQIHRDLTARTESGAAVKRWQIRQNVPSMRQVVESQALVGQGTVIVDDYGTKLHWFLADKPHAKARIALLYKGELHDGTSDGRAYRGFGVDQEAVYRRLWLIIEPPVKSSTTGVGVEQDEGRSHLNWSDGKGGTMAPEDDWRANWYDQMASQAPEVSEALRALNEKEEKGRSFKDPRYADFYKGLLKRMRFRQRILRIVDGEDQTEPTTTTTHDQDVERKHKRGGRPKPDPEPPKPTPGEDVGTQRAGSREGGEEDAYESLARLGLPDHKWIDGPLDENRHYLADWAPGPRKVYLTRTNPAYLVHRDYHRSQRGPEQGGKVDKAVEDVIGEQVCLKVAHAISLGKNMPRAEAKAMLEPSALTVGVLGLEAIDTLIEKRLRTRKLRTARREVG